MQINNQRQDRMKLGRAPLKRGQKMKQEHAKKNAKKL